ncbi:hypothetical protein Mpet_1781 [Methanolacinia petrolearia DSM 11571]|uniref:Uncharacterized protein n=1 Tax=Methanolacinia petrolearia (strain DSM 11571 / OCM 486 / SEBR 4847) TaxID=679926 RepID=E1RI69_METP4|nr:hypothetical protein [Methanolacinia petrolearia]ADN36534.1 hypothetical protein Mpet_1781 [Methanolacinia petrolearia DSM 11571]
MKNIAFIFTIIFICGIVSGVEITTESTQLLPGTGAPVEILTNMYPTVKNNVTIMEYILECGVGSWYSEQVNDDFRSVHLSPADSCGKQLVFLERKYVERGDPAQIVAVWILDVNETWEIPQEYLESSGSSSRAEDKLVETQKSPGFSFSCLIAAIAASVVAFVCLRQGDKR